MVQFSLYPYTQLWRIGNDHYHSNKCSLSVSIIIIAIISGILIERLVAVFKSETITATSYVRLETQHPQTTLSTFQNNFTYFPFMIAFDIKKNNYT